MAQQQAFMTHNEVSPAEIEAVDFSIRDEVQNGRASHRDMARAAILASRRALMAEGRKVTDMQDVDLYPSESDIERAARALYARANKVLPPFDEASTAGRQVAIDQAIAVLEALAEPSDAAVKRAIEAYISAGGMNLRIALRAALRAARLAELGRIE